MGVGTVSYADRTIEAYRRHATAAIKNWSRYRAPSRFLRRFVAALPVGARILDYGCGTGTDMAWMRRRGMAVEGVDGTVEFVKEARRLCPGASIRHERFESVSLPERAYDGVWCHGALIHVPPDVLRGQLEKIRRVLKPGGLVGMTLAWGRAKTFTRRDWIPGRYVAGFSKAESAALFRQGWAAVRLTVAVGDNRQGRWIEILARRPIGGQRPAGARPGDRKERRCAR